MNYQLMRQLQAGPADGPRLVFSPPGPVVGIIFRSTFRSPMRMRISIAHGNPVCFTKKIRVRGAKLMTSAAPNCTVTIQIAGPTQVAHENRN